MTDPIVIGTEGLTAVDLNNDGKIDLAVSAGNGGVDVLLGNGDGTFQPPVNYITSETNYSIASGSMTRTAATMISTPAICAATWRTAATPAWWTTSPPMGRHARHTPMSSRLATQT